MLTGEQVRNTLSTEPSANPEKDHPMSHTRTIIALTAASMFTSCAALVGAGVAEAAEGGTFHR